MTPSPECIALLRAIAAAPDDGVPRQVFADWLEENGTTDADAARVEFIRLSCQMKSKQRLSPAEGKWLDANVRRLLPMVMAKFKAAKAPDGISRDGRKVRIHTSLDPKEEYGPGHIFLHVEYWRGFARRILYGSIESTNLTNLGRELATDEPLAIHASEQQAKYFPVAQHRMLSWVTPDLCQGRAAWERLEGYSRIEPGDRKVFEFPGGTQAEWQTFGEEVVLASIARAMTAAAREGTGWPAEWAMVT